MNILERILSALSAVFRRRNDTPAATVTVTTTRTGYVRPDIQAFIDKIKPDAQEIEISFGIPWKFAMVQAAHESNFGKSLLALEAFNLFGITGDSWYRAGKPVWWRETRECAKDGTAFMIKRPFRKYASWLESLNDWAGLLERRYPRAIIAAKAGDFDGFAKALEDGGYATDRDHNGKLVYAKKLSELHSTLEGIA